MIDTKPPWMVLAEQELARGVREYAGPAANPRIVDYHAATSLAATDDEVPWCSSFVNWCLQHAGYEGTRSAKARSWLTWGDPLDAARYGAIAVFARGKNPTQGHVAFFTDWQDEDTMLILGGNQHDAVSIIAKPAATLLSLRWPRPY